MTRPNLSPELMKQLRWPLRLTWAAMGLERGWRAFWPLVSVLMVATAWARFVGFTPLCFVVLGVSVLATLVWGIRRFRWPVQGEVEARLDGQIPQRPLAALRDNTAIGGDDPVSQSIWQAHQTRMAALAATAKAEAPDLRVADRDPFALRLIATVACVMALMFGVAPQAAQGPVIPPNPDCLDCPSPLAWEGWIEPPAYTGQPSLYLNDQPSGPLPVPAGSRLTLRFYGLDTAPIDLGGDLIDGPPQEVMETEITRNGTLTIGRDGPEWSITAIGDLPPDIRPEGEMTRQISGQFQQAFLAVDDHGVILGAAQIDLALERVDRRHGLALPPDPRPTLTVDLPRPYRGDLRLIEEVWEENLAEHPWAGLPTKITLLAEDGAGQEGRATPLDLTLPARRFFAPEARALIELRRDLLWASAGAPRVAQILRAILHRPDGLSLPEGTYLSLRAVIRELETAIDVGLTSKDQNTLAATLWDIALQIEDTGLNDARERLARAQERLEQAMRDGATEEELSELMDELRDAMKDYLDRLAQNPDQGQQQPLPDGEQMEMSSADLDAMMERIEELMREGRMDEAMQMLDALRRMMENMQVTQGGSEGEGQQARDGLADTLRQQQGLSDEAFRDLQEQGGQGNQAGESQGNTGRDGGQGRGQSHSGEGQSGQGQSGEGQSGEAGDQGDTGQNGAGLAQRQRELQDQLDAQRRNLPGAGSEAGNAARDALGAAGRAMGDAADALEDGDLAGALDRQAEAMEALREGLRQFDDAMNSQQAGREGQQGQTGQDQGSRNARDPLGRSTGSQSGMGATDGGYVTEEDLRRRAQELTDELRRRSGETTRPEEEREYIERLLDQF
ncbi:TIGR02302 family protein [Aliiroseovarius crassostreae]|uniref:TIGR02302 family protein n=1 Tax=Aliiroseovarius crassostreae TaxID=154981 RepID=UPI003C79CECD